jgi:hypothetical protein
MPYGIAKNAGGDSATNVAKMESCVARLTPKHGKQSAIRICKDSIQGGARRRRRRAR